MSLSELLPAVESLSIDEKRELYHKLVRELNGDIYPSPDEVNDSPISTEERARRYYRRLSDVSKLVDPESIKSLEIEADPELSAVIAEADRKVRKQLRESPHAVRIEWSLKRNLDSSTSVQLTLVGPYGFSAGKVITPLYLHDPVGVEMVASDLVWQIIDKERYRRDDRFDTEEGHDGDEH